MEVVPGEQLGQYRVVEQIGRGGMATVYKAFQPALNRYVAIKVLPAFYAEDPRFLERFRQEAQTVSQLRHPSILSVFDFGEQDGVTYMVSELLPGGTIEKYLGQPLSVERALELLEPVASALDYAHARGVIHRDIKPSNILLTDDDTPVLSDFGVARMVAGTNRLTGSGAM
jgi:eukaryotic-like serine/threonine-protein kinase